jgi:hypothetical protein
MFVASIGLSALVVLMSVLIFLKVARRLGQPTWVGFALATPGVGLLLSLSTQETALSRAVHELSQQE